MSFLQNLKQKAQKEITDSYLRARARQAGKELPPPPVMTFGVGEGLPPKMQTRAIEHIKEAATKTPPKPTILTARPEDMPGVIGRAATGVGRFAKAVGQSMARSGAALGAEALREPEPLTRFRRATQPRNQQKATPFGHATYTPRTEIEKKIFGTDKPISIKTIGEETLAIGGEDFKRRFGSAAVPVGFLMAGLDAIPPIGGKKAATKQATKQIAKEVAEQTPKQVARQIPNIARPIVEEVVPRLADAPTPPRLPIEDITQVPTRPPAVERIVQKTKTSIEPKETPINSRLLAKSYEEKGLPVAKAKEMAEAELRLDPTNPSPKQYADYLKFNRGAQGLVTNLKETISNDWQRVVELERIAKQNPNFKIPDGLLPSERKALFSGRREGRLIAAQTEINNIDKDLLTTAQKLGIENKSLMEDVQRYAIARHTPERNAIIGPRATGFSDDEAKAILAQIEASPNAPEIKRLADRIGELDKRVLDTLYADGRPEGVITKELYDLLRNRYKHHVPLQRIFKNTDNIETVLSGRGFDVRKTGIRRAVGSEREVADILTNTFANYTEAIQLVEKNIVDNETLRFVREFQKAFPEQELFEVIKPKAIGKDFNDRIILEKINDPAVLSLREAGKATFIRINDAKLAAAFKGINREQLPTLLRSVGVYTRFQSSFATRYNPAFALTNKIRDLQEAVVFAAAQGELGFKGAAKMATREPQSMKTMIDVVRGIDNEGTRLYQQMVMDGGTTGGMALATRNVVEIDINKIRQLNRSKPREAAQKIAQAIDDWNRIFEDSTRLSVYREALERGASRDRAALLAKRATIDFNQMGTGGPVINSLYMFANASIQGSAKMLRAMRNPRVAAATVGTIGASIYATNNWNDRVDPEWRDKVSKWDRLNSISVVLPSTNEEFNYITIPVSWGLKPIKVAIDNIYDLAEGRQKNIEDALLAIVTATVEGYSPIGGTDFTSAIIPTIADIPVDIARNRAWTGRRIKPEMEWDKYAPQSSKFFRDLKETAEGRMFINIAEQASAKTGGRIEISPADMHYAYNQIISGAGRFVSNVVNTVRAVGTGEEIETRQVPFLNRFFRQIPVERLGGEGETANERRRVLIKQSRENIRMRNEAEVMFEEMKKMPVSQRKETYLRLKSENPRLIERIDRIAEAEEKGLTNNDRLLLDMGIENGVLARYLKTQFEQLKTTEERKEFYLELTRKGIITERVQAQLDILFE